MALWHRDSDGDRSYPFGAISCYTDADLSWETPTNTKQLPNNCAPAPPCAQTLADGCLLRNPAGSVFVIYGRAKFGIPSMDVFNALGLQWANVQNVSDAVVASVPLVPVDGTLLQELGIGSVYVTYGGAKFGIPSAAVFNGLGLNWNAIRTVPQGGLAQIPTVPVDGTLLQELGIGSVYVTYGGAKFGIPSAAVFNGLGLNWNAIRTVPQGGLAQIPTVPVDGTLIQELGVGSVYVAYGGAKFGIPSAAVFNGLGLDWNAIRTVPQGDLAQIPTVPADGTLLQELGVGSVYVTYGGAKFGVPSAALFNQLGLDWNAIRTVPQGGLAQIPTVPADGTLLQELGVGSVYVTYGGAKFGVPSAALFNQLGLNWNAIRTVPQGGLAQIPTVPADGTLLQELGVGSVYVTYGGAKFGVPSAALFNQLGLDWNAIRTVPQGGLAQIPAVPLDGTLLKEYSSPAQYVFYGGARFSIPDPATLLALGLGSTPLRVVPDGEVAALPAVPVDGTLLQPLSDPATYIVCRGTKKTVASLGQFGFLPSAVRAIPPGSLDALASSDPALGNNACNDDDDGDGYTDAREIALGKNPLVYCPIMRADVDGDGAVSILDFVRVAQYFTQTIPPAPARYDQDGDNKISILDFVKMAQVYAKPVSACP